MNEDSFDEAKTRERSTSHLSHQEYLDALQQPSEQDSRRISEIQVQREAEIDGKYHLQRRASRRKEEHEAATKIQTAYRGHRTRRQLQGFTLDPSSRWLELIREMRFLSVTVPPEDGSRPTPAIGRTRATSNARLNWQRIGTIADHAVDDGGSASDSDSSESIHADDKSASSVLLDRRYFLEMVDQRHRYGANLSVYHEEWLRSDVNQNFFKWLDHGEGLHLDLPGCTRAKLDKECIRYLSKDERKNYLVDVDVDGKLRWNRTGELITTSTDYKDSMDGIVSASDTTSPLFSSETVQRKLSDTRHFASELARVAGKSLGSEPGAGDGEGVVSGAANINSALLEPPRPTSPKSKSKRKRVSPATILNHLLRASVKPGTWIYVADSVGRLYVGIKASGAFQHTSFLAGSRITSAGSIGIEAGQLIFLSPLSGHYRPPTQSFRVFLESLKERHADLSHLKISHTYDILRTMEKYGRAKKALHLSQSDAAEKESGTRKKNFNPGAEGKKDLGVPAEGPTERVHRHGITRAISDWKHRRKSDDGHPHPGD